MRKMFSKNQIKDIVNQGIESGEISGGTKLYLHEIRINDVATYNIITTFKEEITYDTDNLISSALAIDNDNGYACVFDYDGDCFYYFSGGNFVQDQVINNQESIVYISITPL